MSFERVTIGPHVLINADCVEAMPTIAPVDAIVTDPPYGLEFMGKEWDAPWKFGISQTGYTDAERLPRPSFSSSRNPTCRTCGKRQRTWKGGPEKCECAAPVYDEQSSTDMQKFQEWSTVWAAAAFQVLKPGGYMLAMGGTRTFHRLTCAIEDAGFQIRDCLMWMYGQGFPKGKACLKPAWEPIILARKPGKKVLPLGVDECRIEGGERPLTYSPPKNGKHSGEFRQGGISAGTTTSGRWPANVVHDGSDEVMEAFAKFGEKKTGSLRPYECDSQGYSGGWGPKRDVHHTGDTGTAARFFYCAKASKADRDEGLDDLPELKCGMMEDDNYKWPAAPRDTKRRNTHPTVKPTALMQWLVKLVARPGECVLDCFAGSGSTLKACAKTGRIGVGIERHKPYFAIACRRIEEATKAEPLLAGVSA